MPFVNHKTNFWFALFTLNFMITFSGVVCLLYNKGDSNHFRRGVITNIGPSSQISMKSYKCRKVRLHKTSVLSISKQTAVETKPLENSWPRKQNTVVTVETDVIASCC